LAICPLSLQLKQWSFGKNKESISIKKSTNMDNRLKLKTCIFSKGYWLKMVALASK
jgi:hypothetical protein